jgi:prevent-host-death family protein
MAVWSGLVWSGTLGRVVRVVNISEAKAQLSKLVAEEQAGERIVIGNAGRPVAVLVPYEEDPGPRAPGGWEGQVWIAEDFDDPLPPQIQKFFE